MITPPLKILYVAYPLLPVSAESCGGAEQVLVTLEREMKRRGHHTVVAACRGSKIAGELLATGEVPTGPDQFEFRSAEHNRRVLAFIRKRCDEFDLVHDHSGTFWQSLDRNENLSLPLLATLHLPRSFYPGDAFTRAPHNLVFNCVSQAQASAFSDIGAVCVRNGINLGKYAVAGHKREYLLWLGRICEEKGAHLAIEVAQRTGRQLIIAGRVYPFSYHQNYFRKKIWPHLDGKRVVWCESPALQQKLELLQNARAVLIPSLVDETSSLVAIEAMACGTPVIAFREGAVPEVIEHGRTGFVVDSVEEMVQAIEQLDCLDRVDSRDHVSRNFSIGVMARRYAELYDELALAPRPVHIDVRAQPALRPALAVN